jgi:hypothetical protein
MCYEGGHDPLAVGSIDNFTFELAVHPSTMQLVRLGCVDESKPAGRPDNQPAWGLYQSPSTRTLNPPNHPFPQNQTHPAQLTSLGNVVLLYGALPEGDPNRTMIAMREGVKGSLIEVALR